LAGALAVFIVLSAVYPMPRILCAVDGALWAAWAQVIAVVLTGLVAISVAWTQLQKFNENEQTKTTIEYMSQYSTRVSHIPESLSVTPEGGLAYVQTVLEDESLRLRLHDTAARVNGLVGLSNREASAESLKEYQVYFTAYTVAANFFSQTAGLAREDLIDGRLFLDFYGLQVVTLWKFIKAFSDVDPIALTLLQNRSLRMFAEQASAAFTSDPKPVI
jgi:apolipoprotein N-acyltransferase